MAFNFVYWTLKYMRLTLFGGFYLEKCGKINMGKQPFFWAATAGLEKDCTGDCGQFGSIGFIRDDTTKGPVHYIPYIS